MVRFGVLGAGSIAHSFSKAIRATEGILQAIASSSLERAQSFSEEYGFISFYDDYDKLMDDEDVDCIYIATAHAYHYQHMIDTLNHGKHVLCEKSFTLNAKQAEEVFKLARAKGLFVMEAMWTRFLPTIQELIQKVSAGVIGEIKSIESAFGYDISTLTRPRLKDPEQGGGALLDIGIYPITMANLFLGRPKSFKSKVDFFDTGVDSYEEIIYRYENAKAKLIVSFEDNLGSYTWIYGTKGKAFVPVFQAADEAYIYDDTDEIVDTITYGHEENGLEYEIKEAISCIENKQFESKTMPHEETLEILRQMDAIRASWNLVYPGE
ncbi:MAG: Gfo/Idh/MocA family oxidoreductase [Bacilli bacterium]|nr:Gfo/Idh/MocA family oxidoreductase [Bacilli bacterium]